jgi:hypothetical protein
MTPLERVAELEKEVKALNRLVKEMLAREKLMATRLAAVTRDHHATTKNVRALDLAARKTDAKIAQVNSRVQQRG